MVTSRLMRHACREARRVILMASCEHKIGMCRCPFERFMFYQDNDAWKPVLMCLLGSTETREGAWFLEAVLIWAMEKDGFNIENNINLTRSKDYGRGAEGRRRSSCRTLRLHRFETAVMQLKLYRVVDCRRAFSTFPCNTSFDMFVIISSSSSP